MNKTADIHSIRHGFPNKPRNQEPSMFQLFTWNQQPDHSSHQKNKNQDHAQGQEQFYKSGNNNQRPLKFSHNRSDHFHPHPVRHSLYMYQDDDEKQRRLMQERQIQLQKQRAAEQLRKKYIESHQIQRHQQEYVSDQVQIEKRKKRIQEFKKNSRQLPDSSFRTYYGKPAFSAYGTGNKSKSMQKKSFNVMPHAGLNHPKQMQTHSTALLKSKVISQSHLPKKPIETLRLTEEAATQSEYFNVPIKKPDLINNIRFSESDNLSGMLKKSRTPAHNELNYIPTRQAYQLPKKVTTNKKKKKLNKVKSSGDLFQKREQYAYMNKRDHLKDQLDEKKRNQSRLAYKVTECHPYAYDCQQNICSTRISKWTEGRVAGVQSPRSDHVGDIFAYNNNCVFTK